MTNNKQTDICNKPLATHPLISYRYAGNYGYIMIGAKNDLDALNEADRSLSQGKATKDKLEIWNGNQYEKVQK